MASRRRPAIHDFACCKKESRERTAFVPAMTKWRVGTFGDRYHSRILSGQRNPQPGRIGDTAEALDADADADAVASPARCDRVARWLNSCVVLRFCRGRAGGTDHRLRGGASRRGANIDGADRKHFRAVAASSPDGSEISRCALVAAGSAYDVEGSNRRSERAPSSETSAGLRWLSALGTTPVSTSRLTPTFRTVSSATRWRYLHHFTPERRPVPDHATTPLPRSPQRRPPVARTPARSRLGRQHQH